MMVPDDKGVVRKIKIVVLAPKSELDEPSRERLARLGRVVYSQSRDELSIASLLKLTRGAQVLMADTDNLGGFEKAKPRLTQVMENLPYLKAVVLSGTSYNWVDLNYCRRRGIIVCNIPGYLRETVAEHTLALLLDAAKRITVSDRRTRAGKYRMEPGTEVFGKTLGIIGLGSIGSRVAELGTAIGMRVIAFNCTPKIQKMVEVRTLSEILKESDVISIHVTDCAETVNIIGKKELSQVKRGVIIVNTADRWIVDEKAMAKYIRSGRVSCYIFEAEDLEHGPLAGLENAVGLQAFGWYTHESLERLKEIWVGNVEAVLAGKPRNIVT